MPKKRTKFDKLVAVYTQIGNDFEQLDHPVLGDLAAVCFRASDVKEQLKNETPPAPPSSAVSGLEQGLRDLSLIVMNTPEDIRTTAVGCYRRALQDHYADFLEKDRIRLQKVLDRGHVRSEGEWYVLQHRLDEIEGDPQHAEEVEKLWELMDNYAG